jgi:hypothetical protein
MKPTEQTPVSAFEILKQTHKDLFDFVLLKNELTVLYSFEDVFDKHPYQLVCSLKSRQLDTALPEVFRLGLLIVTVPSTTASVEISFSALKRIKTYQRSTQNEERLLGLAILSIEKDVLHKLKVRLHSMMMSSPNSRNKREEWILLSSRQKDNKMKEKNLKYYFCNSLQHLVCI